jgi:hypothetical protein
MTIFSTPALAAIASSEAGGVLKFNYACKLLLLNNIDSLTSRMMIELFTSEKHSLHMYRCACPRRNRRERDNLLYCT